MTSKRDHGDGGIDQRGDDAWRLRYRVNGKRYSTTFRGTKRAAQIELRRLLQSADTGAHVEPSKTSIADYLRGWLDNDTDLSPKTRERYRQLAEQQIIPHVGSITLQALRPARVKDWHATLLRAGGDKGRPLSARTVGHAHRVLHRALEQAVLLEVISRNVAHVVRPPKVQADEIEILSPEQVTHILDRLDGHALHPIVAVALGTGMRRGELCALAWGALDLDAGAVRVERSLEETAEGLRFKAPKTKNGRRAISLAASTVAILREHRIRQTELWLQLGLGRPGADDLVFTLGDGSPYPPDKLSRDWLRIVTSRKLPRVMFHALRHSHVSALIAAGLDPVSVSRRVGHSNPTVTLTVYAHLFQQTDRAAADAIEAVFGKRGA